MIILPQDFDPVHFFGVRGLLTSVDLVANQFSIETRAGEEFVIEVGARTRYGGMLEGLSDLEVGRKTSAAGLEQEDGRLLAHIVVSGKPEFRPNHRRFIGKISNVDEEKSTFAIEIPRRAHSLVFTVDESTRFKSREGAVQGLEDLQVGMVCLVAAREGEDGSLLGIFVAVTTYDRFPTLSRVHWGVWFLCRPICSHSSCEMVN